MEGKKLFSWKHVFAGFILGQLLFLAPAWADETDKPMGPPPQGGHFDDNDELLKKARESGNSEIRDFVMNQIKKNGGPQSLKDADFRAQLQSKLDALTPDKTVPPPEATLEEGNKPQVVSLQDAKSLIRNFGGLIDKDKKKAFLSGDIPKICAEHFRLDRDAAPDSKHLYAFALIDLDGQGVSCLQAHKAEACESAHPCVSLRDMNEGMDIEATALSLAHVGLHGGNAVDLNGATEAGTVCNCSAQAPGPTSDSLKKLIADMGLSDDDKKPSRNHNRTPKKEDSDKTDPSSRDNGLLTGLNLSNPLLGMGQNQNTGMMMSSGLSGMNNMNMLGLNGMSSMYGMNNMSMMNMMNSYMMMNYYNSMMMRSMYSSGMYGMNGMTGLNGLSGLSSSLYGGSITGGTLGTSSLSTGLFGNSLYGGSITGGNLGTTSSIGSSLLLPNYMNYYRPYNYSFMPWRNPNAGLAAYSR